MKKNILSVILAIIMVLAVCPAYAEATDFELAVSGDYIINDDFSNATAERPWLEFVDADEEDSATVSIVDGAIKIVRDNEKSANQPYAKIYLKADKSAITRPTAISFTLSRNVAEQLVVGEGGNTVWTFWYKNGTVRPRTRTEFGGTVSAGSKGTFSSPVTLTYVINPAGNTFSMWINGTKKVTDSYTGVAIDDFSTFLFKWDYGNYADTMPATNYFTVDNIKVWEFVKEDYAYSGEGYNNGTLQEGNIALSLPISYIPNGTDNKVTVLMAAYDKATNKLITVSDIEKHTFDGADFFTFTPEMTIPETAGEYYVKTMVWKSDLLTPLCAADELK